MQDPEWQGDTAQQRRPQKAPASRAGPRRRAFLHRPLSDGAGREGRRREPPEGSPCSSSRGAGTTAGIAAAVSAGSSLCGSDSGAPGAAPLKVQDAQTEQNAHREKGQDGTKRESWTQALVTAVLISLSEKAARDKPQPTEGRQRKRDQNGHR